MARVTRPKPSEAKRIALLVAGWGLMIVAPVTAPLPGPGATLMFAGGLALVLRNSAWARRRFAGFTRRWPKLGGWIDWALRRESAKRRLKRHAELTSQGGAPNAPLDKAVPPPHRSNSSTGPRGRAALLRSETQGIHDEADLSAEQSGARPPPRLPFAHGDPGRPQRDSRPPQSRPQEAVGLANPPAVPAHKLATLTQRRDFLAANGGKRAPMPGFVLLARLRADGDPTMRIGYTVTKKIGNAVVRNRMKRRLRALARELLPTHGVAGADHVLIGREGGIERDFGTLRGELAKALAKVAR